jgi:hypothetical protein
VFVAHPLLFWGLAATVAVPVVLHLIMRQSPKHVLFPALRFLQQRREANRRRLRLRHLVLLALRTGVLLFLAAALCRPSMSCSGVQQTKDAPVSAALVIDTSPSMDYEWQNQTRLKAAQETASWLLTRLPDESQVAVLDSDNDVAAFAIDLARAKERIGQLHTTVAPDRLLSVAARAAELLESGKYDAKELYVFTDLSRGEWSPENAAALHERLTRLKSLGVYVIDVGAPEPQNTALGDLRLSAQTVARNTTVQLEQTIARTGGEFTTQLNVVLKDPAGREVPQNPAQVTLKADDSVVMPLAITGLREPGVYQGEIRIANREANQLSADDVRHFTIEVRPPWKLLLAGPPPADWYAWDLRQYLEPKRQRDENRQRFACDVKELSELPRTRLAEYAAVCLLDPPALEKGVWEQLAAYVKAGGSVAIFLGRNAAGAVDSFNEPPAQELLPGRLAKTAEWRESPDGSNRVYLNPGTGHPMLAYFGRLSEPLSWDAFWVRQAWELEEPVPKEAVVVPLTNGKPAILERTVGQGRVVLMTTPVSDDLADASAWNNLFGTGYKNSAIVPPQPFIVLANEMMLYLVGAAGEELNYLAGQTARVNLAGHKAEQYVLIRPSGQGDPAEVPPDSRAVVVGPLKELGDYRVTNQPDDLDRGFSVNLSPQESILARVGRPDLEGIFAATPFSLARDREEINRQLTETRVGHDLFPLLIALAALILAAEHVLGNKFYQETERPTPASGGPPPPDHVATATT